MLHLNRKAEIQVILSSHSVFRNDGDYHLDRFMGDPFVNQDAFASGEEGDKGWPVNPRAVGGAGSLVEYIVWKMREMR